MRKLMYFTLGFAAACGLWAYVESRRLQLLLLLLLLLLAALAGKDARPIQRSALALLGVLAGFGWVQVYDSLYLSTAAAMDGKTANVEIRVYDYSWETDYGTAFDGVVMLDGKPCQVRTYFSEKIAATPGDYVYGDFRFRLTTPEGERGNAYHPGKGIFLLAYQADSAYLVDYGACRRDIPARIRNKVKNIITEVFPEDTAPFAKALLIGYTVDLDYATDTAFKISGIRHVVAVSGLHVSILFALLSTLTFHRKWLTALVGFPALALFAAVAGFTPSVSRACIMSGLMLLSLLASREYDGPTALAFSVLVILGGNPLAITSVSFQLSVASVAGIYLFSPGIRKWITGLFGNTSGRRVKAFFVKWFAVSVSISLSAMVLTTPLCAWYFGTVSLIAPVTNLLALWVISATFYGIMGVCGLYLFRPGLAAMLAKLVSIPIRYVYLVAKVMAKVPMAAVYTASPYIVVWLVFVYLLLLGFLLSRNKRPQLLTCCAVLGLCLAQIAGWADGLASDVRFTVLDVGQGQCLLLQAEGRTYMVDCGGDSDTATADLAANTLLSQGITRLDGLILTHLDRDHAGGAEYLLSRMETDLLILPPEETPLADAAQGRTYYASRNMTVSFGNAQIQIFPPTFPGNSNEMSLCVLFTAGNCDILITGDRNGFGERALLRSGNIPDVEILVAGHHGSKTATCDELLAAIRPQIVCISAGEDNPYGHPAPELLLRLLPYGCTVYRTDLHGTITIRR